MVSESTQSLPKSHAILKYATHALHTHLIPWPRLPLGRTWHSVTGPAALGTFPYTELAVHRAVGAILERLQAAHGAELIARTPAGFGAVFPRLCYPAVGGGELKANIVIGVCSPYVLSEGLAAALWKQGQKGVCL